VSSEHFQNNLKVKLGIKGTCDTVTNMKCWTSSQSNNEQLIHGEERVCEFMKANKVSYRYQDV